MSFWSFIYSVHIQLSPGSGYLSGPAAGLPRLVLVQVLSMVCMYFFLLFVFKVVSEFENVKVDDAEYVCLWGCAFVCVCVPHK